MSGPAGSALHPAFVDALRQRRDEYNARFAQARRQFPELDGALFQQFLRSCVEPMVAAVAALQADAVDPLVSAAYDAALELAGQRLVGPAAAHPWIEQGWRQLGSAAAGQLRQEPGAVLARLSNALHHLGRHPGARPGQWIERLQALLALDLAPAQTWAAGQVAAWASGLAQYRDAALGLARQLPPDALRTALALPEGTDSAAVLAALAADPWFDPAAGSAASRPGVRRLGAFSGYGGLFRVPPRVAASADGHLLVRSGEDAWQLLADHYGSHLQRASLAEFEAARAGVLPSGWSLAGTQLRHGRAQLELGGFGALTSFAATSHTLAFSHAASHALSLVALA